MEDSNGSRARWAATFVQSSSLYSDQQLLARALARADWPSVSQRCARYLTHVSTGGTVAISAPHTQPCLSSSSTSEPARASCPSRSCKMGHHVAIFTGNTLIRAPLVDPTKRYQPLHP